MKRMMGRLFTLVELLVVIAIIAILAALLMPSLKSAKASAQKLACSSNLRQCTVALMGYADEWNGAFPTEYNTDAWGWQGNPQRQVALYAKIRNLRKGRSILACPADTGNTWNPDFPTNRAWHNDPTWSAGMSGEYQRLWYSYLPNGYICARASYNDKSVRIQQVKCPSKTFAFADGHVVADTTIAIFWQYFRIWHPGGAWNMSFLDGHCADYKFGSWPIGTKVQTDTPKPFTGNSTQYPWLPNG